MKKNTESSHSSGVALTIVKKAIRRGRSLNPSDNTAIHLSKDQKKNVLASFLEEGDLQCFLRCYKSFGTSLKWKENEDTILHQAIEQEKIEFVEAVLAIEKQAPEIVDEERLPLIYAKRLVKDKNLPFKEESPLHIAAAKGNKNLVELLVNNGANDPRSCVQRNSPFLVVDKLGAGMAAVLEEDLCLYGRYEHPVIRAIANNHQEILNYFLNLPAPLRLYRVATTEIRGRFSYPGQDWVECADKNRVLTCLLLESIHHGKLELYHFLQDKGATLPPRIFRSLLKDEIFQKAIELDAPGPLVAFLTGPLSRNLGDEREQYQLARVFHQLSPEMTIDFQVVQDTLACQPYHPGVCQYAIETFLPSVPEKDRRSYLKTFLCNTVQNLNHLLIKSLKKQDLFLLLGASWDNSLSLTDIIEDWVNKGNNLTKEEKFKLKKTLTYIENWATELANYCQQHTDNPAAFDKVTYTNPEDNLNKAAATKQGADHFKKLCSESLNSLAETEQENIITLIPLFSM